MSEPRTTRAAIAGTLQDVARLALPWWTSGERLKAWGLLGIVVGATLALVGMDVAFSFWQAGQHIGSQVTDESGATTWHEMYASDAKKARDFYMALLGATADPMPGGLGIMCSSTARRCWPGSCKSIPRGATFARSGSPISRWPTPMRPRRL